MSKHSKLLLLSFLGVLLLSGVVLLFFLPSPPLFFPTEDDRVYSLASGETVTVTEETVEISSSETSGVSGYVRGKDCDFQTNRWVYITPLNLLDHFETHLSSGWSYQGAELTDERSFRGLQSVKLLDGSSWMRHEVWDEGECCSIDPVSWEYHEVCDGTALAITVRWYDTGADSTSLTHFYSENGRELAFGLDPEVSTSTYTLHHETTVPYDTGVPRQVGWHTLSFVLRDNLHPGVLPKEGFGYAVFDGKVFNVPITENMDTFSHLELRGPGYWDEIKSFRLRGPGTTVGVRYSDFGKIRRGDTKTGYLGVKVIYGQHQVPADPMKGWLKVGEPSASQLEEFEAQGLKLMPEDWLVEAGETYEILPEEQTSPTRWKNLPYHISVPLDSEAGSYIALLTFCSRATSSINACAESAIGVSVSSEGLGEEGSGEVSIETATTHAIAGEEVQVRGRIKNNGFTDEMFITFLNSATEEELGYNEFSLLSRREIPFEFSTEMPAQDLDLLLEVGHFDDLSGEAVVDDTETLHVTYGGRPRPELKTLVFWGLLVLVVLVVLFLLFRLVRS